MTRRDLADFILLAAIWGASFLFMRVAAPWFGPVPLMLMRCLIGALVLLPFLLRPAGEPLARTVRERGTAMFVAGLLNSAIPFVLFGYAALFLTAGFASILNAATPIFAAVIAVVWFGERPTAWRIAGLVIGVAGVVVLSADKASFHAGGGGWAILAILAATVCYGIAGNLARRAFAGVDPYRVAAGSQVAATLLLLGPGLWTWPSELPPAGPWLAAIALGALSSGVAYLLFYRLIANVGPAAAMSVTFLIPVFGVMWGMVFLDETIDAVTVVGAAIVLVGTALATGAIAPRAGRRRG